MVDFNTHLNLLAESVGPAYCRVCRERPAEFGLTSPAGVPYVFASGICRECKPVQAADEVFYIGTPASFETIQACAPTLDEEVARYERFEVAAEIAHTIEERRLKSIELEGLGEDLAWYGGVGAVVAEIETLAAEIDELEEQHFAFLQG